MLVIKQCESTREVFFSPSLPLFFVSGERFGLYGLRLKLGNQGQTEETVERSYALTR